MSCTISTGDTMLSTINLNLTSKKAGKIVKSKQI